MALNIIQVVNDTVALLQANEAGIYKAFGYQVIADTPDEAFISGDQGFLGFVRVFHKSSIFPISKGSLSGPVDNDFTIALEFKTAAKAQGDLTVLEDDQATDIQKAAALALVINAELIANGKMDQLFSNIYNIIMNLQYRNLGGTIPIGTRWIGQYEKDDPVRNGSLIALTAGATITGTVGEQLEGAAIPSQPAEKNYDTDLRTTNDTDGTIEDTTTAEVRATN